MYSIEIERQIGKFKVQIERLESIVRKQQESLELMIQLVQKHEVQLKPPPLPRFQAYIEEDPVN